MTREEYVRSLVDQNIPGDQWFDLVKKFESENPQPVEVVEEGKTTDSSQANPSEELSSEVTDSNSEDGSLELSEQDDEPVDYTSTDVKEKTEEEIQKEAFDKITAVAKPGEKFTEKQYDYKYEIVPGEKQPQYYAKEKDSTEWKLQSNDASLNVASLFGHNNLDRSEYYKSNKTLKGSREVLKLGEEFQKSGQNVGGDTKENPMFAVVSEAYNSKIKLTDKEELIILEKAKKFSSAPVINVTRYEEEFDKYNTRNESGLIKVEKNYTVNCAGPDGQNYDECKDWIGDHNAAIAEVAKSQRISRDSINLDDPKTQELINSKMTALAADRFEDKKEKRKLKNWIDSVPSDFNAKAMGQWLLEMIPGGPVGFDIVDAKDVWDRGQLQKQMESYQKDKKFKITKKQEGISEYLNKGGVVLDSISNSYKAGSNGE